MTFLGVVWEFVQEDNAVGIYYGEKPERAEKRDRAAAARHTACDDDLAGVERADKVKRTARETRARGRRQVKAIRAGREVDEVRAT